VAGFGTMIYLLVDTPQHPTISV